LIVSDNLNEDMRLIREALTDIKVEWDGKACVLELKEANFQWKQMEWIGFYFEFLCNRRLETAGFEIPGEKYGNVQFDALGNINWDMKAKAIKSDTHDAILNDINAMDNSIEKHGAHGIILALLDVKYNDDDRSFQQWHSALKGGESEFEKERKRRNATSRYRKRSAWLRQILFFEINEDNKTLLSEHRQGRNADGSSRRPKYMINIEDAQQFEVGRIDYE